MLQSSAISNCDLEQLFCALWRFPKWVRAAISSAQWLRSRLEQPFRAPRDAVAVDVAVTVAGAGAVAAVVVAVAVDVAVTVAGAVAVAVSVAVVIAPRCFWALLERSWRLSASPRALVAVLGRSRAAPCGSWALLGSSW